MYRVADARDEAKPVLREALPGSASSWTPSLARCLEPTGRYAWSVRVATGEDVSHWSQPNLFQVASAPSKTEFEEAVAVVQRYVAARNKEEVTSARNRSTAAATSRETFADSPAPLAPAATELTIIMIEQPFCVVLLTAFVEASN